jgi:hypothetical protein
MQRDTRFREYDDRVSRHDDRRGTRHDDRGRAGMTAKVRFQWGKDPASQKIAFRKLYERLLRSYCLRSVATSLTEAVFSRKFLAVLLKPESLFVSFGAAPKRKPHRGNDKHKDRAQKQTMMALTLICIFGIVLTINLKAAVWEIHLDGSADFTSIQAGIAVAQNGDTILVHPGAYQERINYVGKNMTITSLYDGSNFDESYIANTVIDGNRVGTVVIFNSGETRDAILNGFTIKNGLGENHDSGVFIHAGGLYIKESSPTISNCIIEHNYAFQGSAVHALSSAYPLLKNNTIRYNHNILAGAVLGTGVSGIEFCEQDLNNIYLNHGSFGADLFLYGSWQTPVVIDTFTVAQPDRYFYRYNRDILSDFTLSVNHGKIEPVAADLYVNPLGDNSNSGLTSQDPLKTVAFAMSLIDPDSTLQRTIYLAEGIYSESSNNELFPITIRDHIAIEGFAKPTTILDGEHIHPLIAAMSLSHASTGDEADPIKDFSIKNLTLINGGGFASSSFNIIAMQYVADYTIENIDITNGHNYTHRSLSSFVTGGSYTIKDVHIYDNSGSRAIELTHSFDEINLYAENIRVRNNNPSAYADGGWGIGMAVCSESVSSVTEKSVATLVNLEITDCLISNVPHNFGWNQMPRGNLEISGKGTVRIINATIGNNSSTNLTGGGLTFGRYIQFVEVINSIIYGNIPHNVALTNDSVYEGNASISHSLVEGGEDGVLYYAPVNTVLDWQEGNIDADPLWMGDAFPSYPYMLSENSPAINAGTLDIPDFEFPEFDLAGNPRIYGDSVDMGAYEWNPNVGIEEPVGVLPEIFDYRLYNYPNPVVMMQSEDKRSGSMGTSISFLMPEEGHAIVGIYNLKGQFVRRLFDAHTLKGEHTVFWDGRDEQERFVATGFYMYKLEINGRTVAAGKCTFVK